MLYIKKKAEPKELAKYRTREFASYEGMDANVKNALRVSLLEEQGHLCAYCMSRIESEHQGMKIDHYKPRSNACV